MNFILKAISRLCNLQRDRHLKGDPYRKKTVRKGDGSFKEILGKEEQKIVGISKDSGRNGHPEDSKR